METPIVTSPEGNVGQESAHRLHGVPPKLSISLEHLPGLAQPDGASAGAEGFPGSAATTTSPTESVVSEARPDDDMQITPEEPRAASPWAEAEDNGEDKPEEAVTSAARKAGVHKQAWTGEEDSKLLELVERHGASNWSRIAADLPSRIGKQCRERWHNHLSPAVKKESFSAEEDHAIMQAVAEHGTKWAHIVKLIPGRTDNAIKNRWNSTTRKLWRVQKRCGDLVPGLQEVDFTAMDAAAVAKHLLARGITAAAAVPPKPPAKRRLSLKAEGSTSADADADADAAADPEDGASPPPPTNKRKRTGGGRKRSSAAAADGLALLRAATFRSATYTLMEAAAAAAAAHGGEEGAEEEASSVPDAEGAGGGDAAAAVAPSAVSGGATSCPATPAGDAVGGGEVGTTAATTTGFTLDALTLLAQSSVGRIQEAGCRSPRMLEAALALGGAFDLPCLH